MFTLLLQNRYLLRELIGRDIQTRYIGSIVGFFWSILNPLVQLALYTVIFNKVLGAKFESTGSTPRFALYLFCALLPWMAIQESVTRASRTFIENSNLIQKVHFPLPVLPFSLVASAFIHQCMGTIVLLVALLIDGSLNYQLCLLIIPLFCLQIVGMFGLSVLVACLNVFFRDVAQLLGVVFMLCFWLTPIVYPKTRAPDWLQWILNLNPFTHMVEAYRFVLLGSPALSWTGLSYWLLFCIGSLMVGSFVLSRTRRELVDLI
jgi:ABC-type polysaccharide/polyol phosphate export permease